MKLLAELSREGHRKRAKESYINGSASSLSDHNLLELVLFYAIPRKDVKPIAYALMNRFGSLERVFTASLDELCKVDGIGKNAAVLIKLFRDINERISLNRNDSIKKIDHYCIAKEYCQNLLFGAVVEKVAVVTLRSDLSIIGTHIVSEGSVNVSNVEPRKIVSCAISDNASSVLLSHNHPDASYIPSKSDLVFTESIYKTLRSLSIKLVDHIIVSPYGSLSLYNDSRYSYVFDNND